MKKYSFILHPSPLILFHNGYIFSHPAHSGWQKFKGSTEQVLLALGNHYRVSHHHALCANGGNVTES